MRPSKNKKRQVKSKARIAPAIEDKAFAALTERLSKAARQGKSSDERFGMVTEFLTAQPKEYAQGRRDELLEQVTILQTQAPLIDQIAKTKDSAQATAAMVTAMANIAAMEPADEREAREREATEKFERARAKVLQWREEHRRERAKRGLSAEAGTGTPDPPVLLIKDAGKRRGRPKVGASRIGGLPDLPATIPWPTYKKKKLPFLAQIDLSALAKPTRGGNKGLLPPDGWLYAFGLFDNDPKHHPHPVAVFFHGGPQSTLKRAKKPADNEIWPDWGKQRVYDPVPVTLKPRPRGDKTILGDYYGHSPLAGWVFGEVYGGFGAAGEIADQAMLDGDDWINLLAIQSVGSMQWSDVGHLYLLVRRSDLERRDLSQVMAAVRSS